MQAAPAISLFVSHLIVLTLQLYLSCYSISSVWLPLVCKLNLAAVPILSLHLCQREPVSRGIVSSCCLLYIWKWLTCLSPAYKVDVFFFSLSLFIFCLLSISYVTGSALWQSLRLRALCAPTMSIADGRFNYCACECVCQPHISSWRGRCLQKQTRVVIFCVLMLVVDRQNRSKRPSAWKPPQMERKCGAAHDFTPPNEEWMETHTGVKIIRAAVVRKTASLIYF